MRRPVLPGDVTAVARALLSVPRSQRQALCTAIFCGADKARRWSDREGRLHPGWGDGSLSAAARKQVLADEPTLDNPDYLRCLIAVLQAVLHRVQR
ncbi:hypothetical protein PXK00_03265 [Phaeobacter sp. QD34_3]|uniref:DUF7742 family protein n=1 Tax=unclassified Phaeobacter TaxID=2621772 RepID=UPI00237F8BF3|nr:MULTISPECIES: hypothetical protein [unclassified Phaeobacter]MDE4132114.1 hypothetical protein [Phaeobacter sp. QD34_3]MDE4135752.1 hypothetical protein [Phaeobacter sp. QD34_24]